MFYPNNILNWVSSNCIVLRVWCFLSKQRLRNFQPFLSGPQSGFQLSMQDNIPGKRLAVFSTPYFFLALWNNACWKPHQNQPKVWAHWIFLWWFFVIHLCYATELMYCFWPCCCYSDALASKPHPSKDKSVALNCFDYGHHFTNQSCIWGLFKINSSERSLIFIFWVEIRSNIKVFGMVLLFLQCMTKMLSGNPQATC